MMYPEWNVRHFFNVRTLQSAFRSDSRVVTRAMTKVLTTPTEIQGSFDYVVYAKGELMIFTVPDGFAKSILFYSWKCLENVPECSW